MFGAIFVGMVAISPAWMVFDFNQNGLQKMKAVLLAVVMFADLYNKIYSV